MAYTLKKPCSEIQKADFISKYNHNQGLIIAETPNAIFALYKNEKIENGIPAINRNYENEIRETRKRIFEKNFFKTSLGWISRKYTNKNGEYKDFFADELLIIKAALDNDIEVEITTYKNPDFNLVQTEKYHKSLQVKQKATLEFVTECIKFAVTDIIN